jgi:hypothetical protein
MIHYPCQRYFCKSSYLHRAIYANLCKELPPGYREEVGKREPCKGGRIEQPAGRGAFVKSAATGRRRIGSDGMRARSGAESANALCLFSKTKTGKAAERMHCSSCLRTEGYPRRASGTHFRYPVRGGWRRCQTAQPFRSNFPYSTTGRSREPALWGKEALSRKRPCSARSARLIRKPSQDQRTVVYFDRAVSLAGA